MDPPPHQAPNPPGSKYCDGIFCNETHCGMTLEGETSVQEACDKVAHALAEKLISGSGARVIDANDWNVDFHPPVEDPAQTRLSDLKGERLRMIFSVTFSVPVLAQALHAADDAKADKSLAEFISEFLREDKVKFEEDNRRLEKEIKEIRETHRTEMEKLMDEMKRMNAENTQRFKVQLEEQRKDLEDQMGKKVSGLRQEHKVQLDEQGKDLEDQMGKKVSGLRQEHKVQLDEQRKDLEDQMEKKVSGLRQEHKVHLDEQRKDLEDQMEKKKSADCVKSTRWIRRDSGKRLKKGAES